MLCQVALKDYNPTLKSLDEYWVANDLITGHIVDDMFDAECE